MQKGWKSCIALCLAVSMIMQTLMPMQTRAENDNNYLPVAEMPGEIESAEAFYVGTTSADLNENEKKPYLLKIGRGGKAENRASVVLKISDATAKYGKDYKLFIRSERNVEVDNPKDNKSLLELFSENEVIEDLQITEEEKASAVQENVKALTEQVEENTESSSEDVPKEEQIPTIEENTEDVQKPSEENSKEEVEFEEENMEPEIQMAEEAVETEEKKTNSSNPLAQAKENLTGIESDREIPTSAKKSMVDVLSESGNFLTEQILGATLKVEFEAGEKEKYVEIQPIDNEESDGDRSFYVTLSEPSEGMSNSIVSESIFTLKDDEPKVDAEISFEQQEYVAEAGAGSVEVVLKRNKAMTQVVNVRMTSEAGTAVSGRDFAPVDADVLFPFGIDERRLKIPIDSQYLTEDATFTLRITDGTGAVAGQESTAKIIIQAKEKTESTESKEIAAFALQSNSRASDVRYGQPIDMSNAYNKERNNGGACTYEEGVLKLHTQEGKWLDVQVSLNGKLPAKRQYVYDGVRFRWRKTSRKSSYSTADVAYYEEGKNQNKTVFYSTGDRPRWNWEEREYYFNATDAAAIKFHSANQKYCGNVLSVDWVKPILRPFEVTLEQGELLKYDNGNGEKKADVNSANANLDNANGKSMIRYDGEKMVINAQSTEYSRLIGVEIVSTVKGKKDSTKIDKRYLNNFKVGDNKISVSLNNDFCTEYAKYIGYEPNGGAGNGKSIKGKIKLKPVFGYIDSVVRVEKNTEGSAANVDCKVKINGKEVAYGKEYTYHYGDRLKFESVVPENYIATGMSLTFKDHTNGGKNITEIGEYSESSYSRIAKNEKYTIVPQFREEDNSITVRVSEEDAKKFKPTGMFDANYLKKHSVKKDGYYEIEVVGKDDMKQKAGTEFILAVSPKDGIIPIWQETNSSKYFMGDLHYYIARIKRVQNVISLYASEQSGEYAAVKGSVYFENRTLRNLSSAGEPIQPAAGGYLTIAGECAIADTNGLIQTKAFLLPTTIKKGEKVVSLRTTEDPLYVQAKAGASGAIEKKDICLNASGAKITAQTGDNQEVEAQLVDLSIMTISCNAGDQSRFTGIQFMNNGFTVDSAQMDNGITEMSVSVQEYERITETGNKELEKVESVNFLIVDQYTDEVKHTIKALKRNDLWVGKQTFKADGSESTLYSEGDRIYVQMITNKKAELLENVDTNGDAILSEDDITEDAKNTLSQTTYAPVNTGYFVTKTDDVIEPAVQKIDVGSLQGLSGIPLVNNFNTNLNLGPVALTVENIYDDQGKVSGTRFKIVLGLNFEITTIKHSKNNFLKDDGVSYPGIKDMFKDLGTINESYKTAAQNIKNAGNLGKTGLASMGASKWGVYPSVGFYLDFALKTTKDDSGTIVDTQFVIQGGGIYLGASATFSVAWYALIPVVYIPCYFGVAGELGLALTAGGTTISKDDSEKMTQDEFEKTSHNLSEVLVYDHQYSGAATIQVYCGVGICGTLGVRGGMEVGGNFLWYPTIGTYYDYFKGKDFGGHLNVGFKMWVDLLLFSIPIPVYSIGQDFGLLKEYKELKDKNEDEILDFIKPNHKGEKMLAETDAAAFANWKQPSEITYELKERTSPSKWNGKMTQNKKARAAFSEENTHTILADGYDRPDAQMLDMGEHGTLLVFIQDDKSRADEERTAVSYSVYKDGVYSKPVIIQTDHTADYQPSVTDAGDHVLITWISRDPKTETTNMNDEPYQNQYLKGQEVYVVSVPKEDLASNKKIDQEQIIKLTEDEYYDSAPVAVYDKKSGDYNVYYVKTAEDAGAEGVEALDLANPFNTSGKTYSVMAYRVYDAAAGKWAVDEYKPNEKPDSVTDEEYKEQLRKLGGQRILSSPIRSDDINMEDPLIADFTAIGYNGVGIFTYSIDKDNSIDTDTDRDLFIQLYDFESRSTYMPIRITDDNQADSMPQLVRRGGDDAGTTYLFYMSGDTLSYIDVSSLVKYGIDENGNIIESVRVDSDYTGDGTEGSDEDIYQGMSEEEIAKATYSFRINEVDVYGKDENKFASYSQYKVAVDAKDNLYVIWVDNGNADGKKSSQEIFATAMIESEAKNAETEQRLMKSWSYPNKLTKSGRYCDEPAIAVTEEGNMLIVYNKYDIMEDSDGQVSCANLELTSSILAPTGSVEATEILLSDETPNAGDEVEVSVLFENKGLTAAIDGFTAEIFERTKDGKTKLVETYEYTSSLTANDKVPYTFIYTANDKTPGSTIAISVTEKNVKGQKVNNSKAFMEKAEYQILQNNSYQADDSKFYSEVKLQNIGNKSSDKEDQLRVDFTGPYGNAQSYGIEDSLLAKEVVSLQPGETTTVKLELNIPKGVFKYYGYITVSASVVGQDEKVCGESVQDDVYIAQPAHLVLNENKNLELKEGDSTELNFQYETYEELRNIAPQYESDNEGVVRVENGKLIAVGSGTATVTAYAYPYNTAVSIDVTVKGTSGQGGTETEDPETNLPTGQGEVGDSSGTKGENQSVDTGDKTDFPMLIFIMVLSFGCVAGAAYLVYRQKSNAKKQE